MNDFDFIVPCGIQGSSVTSIKQELKKEIKMSILKPILLREIEDNFDCEVLND